MTNSVTPRPFHEWHEDIGSVLWWLWPIEQPPYVGSPLDLGRTVSFDLTVQVGIDTYETVPVKLGDTGGWPFGEGDDEDGDLTHRLYWTPLPDCEALDKAIRDDIRRGPEA